MRVPAVNEFQMDAKALKCPCFLNTITYKVGLLGLLSNCNGFSTFYS